MLYLRRLSFLSLDIDADFTMPIWFGRMTSIERLNITTEGQTKLPAELGDLANLRRLTWMTRDRSLELDADWLPRMCGLETLHLLGDGFVALPDSFSTLSSLTRLTISAVHLAELPSSCPAPLRKVDIDLCSLSELPDWFAQLDNVRVRSTKSFTTPPPDVVEQGGEAILAFIRARTAAPPLQRWDSKLLIVGEATVGKTSLTKRLTGGEYDPDEGQTHGVHIDPLALPHPDLPDTTMELRVWDFGGQLEYRATQRFYLTDRSLFLLVWNARARWRDGKVTAWLDVISARAPQSPVLIVATHGDEPSAATLPSDLRSRYPQIAGIFTVDSASGNGIDGLRAAVRTEAAGLPLMGRSWPAAWAAAGDTVRDLPGYAATARHVWESMASAGVTDPSSQQVIARSLHDLGDVVFFADDPDLAQRMILRPAWLDARISAVLDSAAVADRRGVLTRAERDRIWGDLDDPDLSDRLIRIMERFDLAYRIGDAEASDEVALIVERLDDARPPGADEAWARAGAEPGVQEIGIAYRLKSRQAGIPTWFIAREHRYTVDLHWVHGAVFHDRDPDHPAWALLVDDGRDQPTIVLRVRGRFPVRFLSVLAEAFEQILTRRYPGLLEQRLVPCACAPRPTVQCGHLFVLDELILEATDPDPRADHRVRCPRSRTKIDARTMLDGLRGSALEAAIDGLQDGVDGLQQTIDEQASTLARIDERSLATLNGVRTLLEHRATAGVHCPSLFEIVDIGRSGFPPQPSYQIRLWCEWPYGPAGPHPLSDSDGVYEIRRLPKWLREYLPYLSALASALGLIAPLAAPALAAAGVHLADRTTAGFETVAKLAEDLKDVSRPDDAARLPGNGPSGPLRRAETEADFRTLRIELTKLDQRRVWGGLSAVERPEDRRIVYLCPEHIRALEYPYRA